MGLQFRKNKPKKRMGCLTILLLIIGISLALAFSPFLWLPGIVAVIIFAIKKSPDKKRNLLISSSVSLISFFIFFAILSKPAPALTDIEVEWTTNEYDITDTAEVKISPVPKTADIESLTLSKNSVASLKYKDGKAIVTFKAEGSQELYFIANKDIESTPKLIKVINKNSKAKQIAKEKKEAERIAAEQAAQAEADRIAAEQAAQAEADRIAAEQATQAEADRIAAEQAAQAEADRIAAEQAAQAEADRIAAEQAAQQQNKEQMVWISATGSKYHSKPNCGRMNPNSAYQMSLSQAKSQGYGACSKCH